MIKLNTLTAVAASALLLSFGAYAASSQPADGNQPYANTTATTNSKVQRSAVKAEAIKNAPADGIQNAKSAAAPNGKALTRAQVKQQTQAAEQANHGFADQTGDKN